MRYEVQLSNTVNTFSVDLPFNPDWIIVLNNTSNPVYFNRGNTQIPGSVKGQYNYVVPAASNGIPSNVQLPTNSYQWAGYLPTTPALSDTTQVVTVIFTGNLKKK